MNNEYDIIQCVKNHFPQFIGDDCAILPYTASESLITTTDIFIENIHFKKSYTTPEALAHKALHVNLSDIAAMGGKPHYVLSSLAVLRQQDPYIDALVEAFSLACKTAKVTIIGGDTSASLHDIIINITVMGTMNSSQIKRRSTAKIGDIICLAGYLGYAHIGLLGLEKQISCPDLFKQHFLYPHALIQEGMWLSQQTAVHAMMDTSDGLYIDLKRLCESSQIGANIHVNQFPQDPLFLTTCNKSGLNPKTIQINGGEDYGLLFTVDPNDINEIANNFKMQFNTPLHILGEIISDTAIKFYNEQQQINIPLDPFDHFKIV